jgi:hypothetical protein
MTLYHENTLYHEIKKKRTFLDWVMLFIVVAIAGIVIALSFHNTTKLARELSLDPYLTAGLVEILFGSLLFIRGRQRALQRNVPLFLETGYFISLSFVTAVNMWGLSLENSVIGPVVGLAISGSMWLMETTLVWLWTSSHEPYQKSIRQRMQEAKREIKEEKAIQRIEWMKWEARKPDLSLIRKARKAEEKRKEVVGDGLPEFFLKKEEPIKEIVAELERSEPKTVDVQDQKEANELVPFRRQIGFHMERTDHEAPPASKSKPKSPAPLFQPNLEARAKAIETAKRLKEELGRLPKQRELIENGLTEYYAKWARQELKKHV